MYVFSPEYEKTDIGNHIFPLVKYRLIKERLIKGKQAVESDFITPEKADIEDVLLVHTRSYLDKLLNGTLSLEEQMKLEIPYSKHLVEASLICVGGSILASETAMSCKVGVHIGGGFHHAYPDHGEGFCVLHDVAVAVKKMIRSKRVKKVLIIDCDLHQGNGTAYIFNNNPDVFTFSMHQEDIYPYPKEKSSLDVELPIGTGDTTYCDLLEKSIQKILKKFKPDMLYYVAGADPFKGDQLSGLDLTIEGLKQRDSIVVEAVKKLNIPLVVTLAGGYAADINNTVIIQYNTCIEAAQYYAQSP